jgi:hypothetical protein
MWVTGYEVGEGTICCERKDFQYCCSGVIGDGPLGSFTC